MIPTWMWIAQPAAFVFGATVGSFLNVVIHRLPRGESIVHPRSKCPACNTPIAAWHNIPILSWLLLGGRCATCRTPISPRYPTIELLTGLLWLAVVTRYGLTWAALAGVVLASSLVAISFIDLAIWEIPDEISLPGVIVGAAIRPIAFGVPWWSGVVGAAAGAAILFAVRWAFMKLRGVEGMGLGDVKLIGMIGAFLGPAALLPVILTASTSGALIGVAMLSRGRREEAQELPSEPAPEPPPMIESAPQRASDAPVPETTDADEDDWTPPPTAVPFGPFLALGALAELLIGPLGNLLNRML